MKKNGKKRQTKKELANELNISERTLRNYQKNGKLPQILAQKKAEETAKEAIASFKTDSEWKSEIRSLGLQVINKTIKELLELKIDYEDIENRDLLLARLKLIEVLGKL